MTHATSINPANFQAEVVQSDKPVLVDFWAPWCGPCRMMAPALDEIAASDERFKITKLNIEDHPELASRFGVRAVPTLLFFKGGQVREQVVGALPKHALLQKLEAIAAA